MPAVVEQASALPDVAVEPAVVVVQPDAAAASLAAVEPADAAVGLVAGRYAVDPRPA